MKRCLTALFFAVFFISCVQEEISNVLPEHKEEIQAKSDAYVPGEAYVYFNEEMASMIEEVIESGSLVTKSSDFNNVIETLNISNMRRLFPHAGEYEPRTRKEGLHRWYVISYSDDIPMTKAQENLIQIPGVEIMEPAMMHKINDFNDLLPEQWGHHNTEFPGVDVNILPVWRDFTTGSDDVIVSVVDTGVEVTHSDLSANCLDGGHYNYCTNSTVIEPGDHGTHVAGVIAAVSNNGKGIAGLAGGDAAKGVKGVKIISCQGLTADGSGSAGVAALKGGADRGAIISQNSWGANLDFDGDGTISQSEIQEAINMGTPKSYRDAIDYFIKYAGCDNYGNQLPGSPMKGGVVIFAAGNSDISVDIPSMYENAIAVGSIASDGSKSSFSNFGEWVDICAPGTSIYSTITGNTYGNMSGTSMACPYVSGVAALLVSYFGGPGFTNEMLKEKLLNSTNHDAVKPNSRVGGLVDAYGAFVYGNDKAPAAVSDLEISGYGNKIDLSFTVPGDEDGKAAHGIMAIYSQDRQMLENVSYDDYEGVSYSVFTPGLATGEKALCTITGLEFEKEYYVKVYAYSYGRNYSGATDILSANTTENNAPIVTTTYDGDYIIMPSETIVIPIEIVEPDKHAFTVEHIKASEAETLVSLPDGTLKLTISGKGAETGTYTSKIIGVDEFGMQGVLEIIYTIKENSAPVKLKDMDNILLKSKGSEIVVDMAEYVSDPDGESLKYEVTVVNNKVAYVNPKDNNLIITALAYGTTDVEVAAKDARGESAVLNFTILVKDPSKPVSVYPNPVTDYVNVGTMEEAETGIVILNQTGKVVVDEKMKASAFEPAKIDMRTCAPGIYTMVVTIGGTEYKEKVVKL